MRESGVRRIFAEGGSVINAWLGIPNSFSAESIANQDFDSVTVDMQHGMVDWQAAVAMLQAISITDKTPLARVAWNEPDLIMKTLDAGAYGIVCPMINTAEECERFVGACRYAPRGYRSFGPPRGFLYGGADYPDHADDTILTLAMIETTQAIDNLEAILAVEELDGVYVGPSDLALSLGIKPEAVPTSNILVDAIATICQTTLRHDKIPGIHCSGGKMARDMIGRGFRFTTIASDQRLMIMGAVAELQAARG